jgi:hypothetical protein
MPRRPDFVAVRLSKAAAIVLLEWLRNISRTAIPVTHASEQQALADLLTSLESAIAEPSRTQLDAARSQLLEAGGKWLRGGNTLINHARSLDMSHALKIALVEARPLEIDGVDWHDPTLTLLGYGWSLAVTCPWQVTDGQKRLFAWDDADVSDRVPTLVHHVITDVRQRSQDAPNDPAFVLTGGLILEISADSDLDPWVLLLPTKVFVGIGPRF